MNNLELLPEKFDIHKIHQDSSIPPEIYESSFYNVCRTPDELSIVCNSEIRINSIECDSDWSCIKVTGTLDFSLIGIIAKISEILKSAAISIFVVSTYNTDYILVKTEKINDAVLSLKSAGYIFNT